MEETNIILLKTKYPFLKPAYIDCDDGWFELIDTLCSKIQQIIENTPDNAFEDFAILVIKEKFGGLRIYNTSISATIGKLIDETEEQSYHICEICGKKGVLSRKYPGIYKTLCKRHQVELGFEELYHEVER